MAHADPPVRPFGRGDDLEVVFDGSDRPSLVTALLARCSEAGDPRGWWAQRVGRRIAVLLRVAAESDHLQAFTVERRCSQPACGTAFEMSLPLDQLDSGSEADRIAVALPAGGAVMARLPTGEDQRRWAGRAYASRREAIGAITGALVVEGQVAPDDDAAVAALADALADHDPLVNFTVSCSCPACGETNETAIDLEGLALGHLARRRRALIEDVHALASAYGWTEAQVLAISEERRASYRALVDGAAG